MRFITLFLIFILTFFSFQQPVLADYYYCTYQGNGATSYFATTPDQCPVSNGLITGVTITLTTCTYGLAYDSNRITCALPWFAPGSRDPQCSDGIRRNILDLPPAWRWVCPDPMDHDTYAYALSEYRKYGYIPMTFYVAKCYIKIAEVNSTDENPLLDSAGNKIDPGTNITLFNKATSLTYIIATAIDDFLHPPDYCVPNFGHSSSPFENGGDNDQCLMIHQPEQFGEFQDVANTLISILPQTPNNLRLPTIIANFAGQGTLGSNLALELYSSLWQFYALIAFIKFYKMIPGKGT